MIEWQNLATLLPSFILSNGSSSARSHLSRELTTTTSLLLPTSSCHHKQQHQFHVSHHVHVHAHACTPSEFLELRNIKSISRREVVIARMGRIGAAARRLSQAQALLASRPLLLVWSSKTCGAAQRPKLHSHCVQHLHCVESRRVKPRHSHCVCSHGYN